jgi:hypothetical protein
VQTSNPFLVAASLSGNVVWRLLDPEVPCASIRYSAGNGKAQSLAEGSHLESVCTFLDALRAREVLAAMCLHRVYWYDAPPLDTRVTKPLPGGKINFGVTSLARTNALLLAARCEVPSVIPPSLVMRENMSTDARLYKAGLPLD